MKVRDNNEYARTIASFAMTGTVMAGLVMWMGADAAVVRLVLGAQGRGRLLLSCCFDGRP